MKKILYSFLLLLCCSFLVHGKRPGNISGTVLDIQKKPLEFATVVLLSDKDSSIVKGVFTDDKGMYSFEEIPSVVSRNGFTESSMSLM